MSSELYCSCRWRKVNLPLAASRIIFSESSMMPLSFMSASSPRMSPRPSSLETKLLASKAWKSSKCSPEPKKVMGEPVAATAESAPPPLAWPSSLVMMTEPTATESLKALAWPCAAWPMVASMTKTTSSGLTTAEMASISAKSAASCLWRPDVSTMMIS